jgi:hypothetical protein
VPLYIDGKTINIILLPDQLKRERYINFVLKGDLYEITLHNIIFGTNLKIDILEGYSLSIITSLINTEIGKITINSKNGEIQIYGTNNTENQNAQLRSTITSLLNYGTQSKIAEMLNCPGIVFDSKDFMMNTFPLIEMILRYLYDTHSIKSATVTIGNNSNIDVSKSFEIDIIGIIDHVRDSIDEHLKKQILKIPEINKKFEDDKIKDDDGFFDELNKGYKIKEIERQLISKNKISRANSLQQMVANILISKRKINQNNVKIYEKHGYEKHENEFIKLIADLSINEISDNDMVNITTAYNKLLRMKHGILDASLNMDMIDLYYHNLDYPSILDKYLYTKQMIDEINITAKGQDPYYDMLNKIFTDNVKKELGKIIDVKLQFRYLCKLFEYKYGGNESIIKKPVTEWLSNIIRTEFIDKLTMKKYASIDSLTSFFTHVFSGRLQIKYPYLMYYKETYIVSYINNFIHEINEIIDNGLYDDIILFKNGNYESIVSIYGKTGGKILDTEYKLTGSEENKTKFLKEVVLLPLKETNGAESIIIRYQPPHGYIKSSMGEDISLATMFPKLIGGLLHDRYYPKYLKYKSKYIAVKHNHKILNASR